MSVARIYRPAKSAMQSGRAKSKKWLLEFEPNAARTVEPVMGWVASADTRSQVRLRFDTLDEAISYAESSGIAYHRRAAAGTPGRPPRTTRPSSGGRCRSGSSGWRPAQLLSILPFDAPRSSADRARAF